MGSKKSDDEATRTSLSVKRMKARAPGKSAEELAQDDNYEPTLLSGKRANPAAGAAAEVSRGRFREGAHQPRPMVAAPEILAGLKVRLGDAAAAKDTTEQLVKRLAKEWLPLLRQAVEQGAGDGIDGWLGTILKLSGASGLDVLLVEVQVTFERMRAAENRAAAIEEAGYAIDAVQRALVRPRKASFKVLERELEGKLDVDELLKVILASTADLERRLAELEPILGTLKGQFGQMGGAKPDGLYVNYTRLKAEQRVIEGEVGRRKMI
jgi:hypothetical protein